MSGCGRLCPRPKLGTCPGCRWLLPPPASALDEPAQDVPGLRGPGHLVAGAPHGAGGALDVQRGRGVVQGVELLRLASATLPLWLLSFSSHKLYSSRFVTRPLEEFRRIGQGHHPIGGPGHGSGLPVPHRPVPGVGDPHLRDRAHLHHHRAPQRAGHLLPCPASRAAAAPRRGRGRQPRGRRAAARCCGTTRASATRCVASWTTTTPATPTGTRTATPASTRCWAPSRRPSTPSARRAPPA